MAVVTDSAACVPPALAGELDIRVVPFELAWDGVVYRDGIDLGASDFYRRFATAGSYPTTSQPPVGAFLSLYEELARQFAGIVSIHVASELTGAVRTAKLAASMLPGVPVRVVDSGTATIAEGFSVLAAARAARDGADLDQVAEAAERVSSRVRLYATLKTLEHVHRGGRLGDAAKLLPGHLKIVPVLDLTVGRVRVAGVTRSWQNALEQIVDLAAEQVGGGHVHASSFHADCPDDAEWLRDEFMKRLPVDEFLITEFTPVMGAHTGPGVVGLACYADG